MQLELGSTRALACSNRCPRRLAPDRYESLNGELISTLEKVVGEGANHCTRGGRAPLQLNSYG